MNKQSDDHILALIQEPASLNEGFRILVNTYQERVYWQVRRMVISHQDADDVVQNVFIKVFQYLNTFRRDSSLYTWIYRITVNEIFTHLKSLRRRKFISFDSVAGILEQKMKDDPYFSGEEVQNKLQKAILRLPEKQRLVFTMKYYDQDLTFAQLSGILDTSEGALKASYHHAVKKIEKMIGGD